jgi:FtsH-binding integral membrane protein
MNQMYDVENRYDGFAADSALEARIGFIRKVYGNLLGATLLFVACAALFVNVPTLVSPLISLVTLNRWGIVLLMVGFMAAQYVAQAMASNGTSRAIQYGGLGLYAVAEAFIFSPLLMIISRRIGGTDLIMQAGTVTLIIFGGLTTIVMLTRSDFSFMRNFLWVGGLAATGVIFASVLTGSGMTSGLLFTGLMIVLFSAWILYDTSNVLHHYEIHQDVAASLALFSSLATLFWYVLRFMSSSRD